MQVRRLVKSVIVLLVYRCNGRHRSTTRVTNTLCPSYACLVQSIVFATQWLFFFYHEQVQSGVGGCVMPQAEFIPFSGRQGPIAVSRDAGLDKLNKHNGVPRDCTVNPRHQQYPD